MSNSPESSNEVDRALSPEQHERARDAIRGEEIILEQAFESPWWEADIENRFELVITPHAITTDQWPNVLEALSPVIQRFPIICDQKDLSPEVARMLNPHLTHIALTSGKSICYRNLPAARTPDAIGLFAIAGMPPLAKESPDHGPEPFS